MRAIFPAAVVITMISVQTNGGLSLSACYSASSVRPRKKFYLLADNNTGGLDPTGKLTAPVVGEFRDGVNLFICDDESTFGRKLQKPMCNGNKLFRLMTAKPRKQIG